jgi:hypothetical protein
MRHGVQSSNCTRSRFNASLNVGVVTSGVIATKAQVAPASE